MEYRHLGDSGLLVSTIGLGTNNLGNRLDERASGAVAHAALDAGVTFVDTADIYGLGASETILGDVLGDRRPDAIIATKVANPMSDSPYDQASPSRWIMRAVEGCLRRLRTDWIDLLQLHVPDPARRSRRRAVPSTTFVESGKVTYVGYSNFDAWHLVEAGWTPGRNTWPGRSRRSPTSTCSGASPRPRRTCSRARRVEVRAGHHPILPARVGVPDRQVRTGSDA